jgi:hypothetical protein
MGVKHESKLLTETVCDDGDDDKNDARAHTSANNVRQASEEEEEAEVCSSAQVLWSESARACPSHWRTHAWAILCYDWYKGRLRLRSNGAAVMRGCGLGLAVLYIMRYYVNTAIERL